ncbi:Rid family hydrolase [Pelobacter propionicus]|uniref:Endoribonuclease L-PSP n=1 Tax=Pelobacter propionicus (strain DSM 2379 / NBRC 103807 / OttBd1) TaxID=338966 RepID=A1AM64_PELPD|nr:Rid family hydrolase [Pelobacter propionicus]ABK98434.1 Endoribonuclease L-PSP [Pelobacter propionicus DSM 2379]
MHYHSVTQDTVRITASSFCRNRVSELHLMAVSDNQKAFSGQMEDILGAVTEYLSAHGIPNSSVVFTRFFLSDYANQAEELSFIVDYVTSVFGDCAVSIVQQPPAASGKIAVWAYVIDDGNRGCLSKFRATPACDLVVTRGGYEHIWSTQLVSGNCSTKSFDQAGAVFTKLSHSLEGKGYSLKENCVRTWLFVKDIDSNYSGVVDARRRFFETVNMTWDTHYIASTGIEGRHADPGVCVLLDAYSIGGVQHGQIGFLKAPDFLNPTHEYGVTFERGTSVAFGDRKHIFISGTASINHKGEIMHRNDVVRQLNRTFVNIMALLADAGAGMENVAQMIVYLRDPSDSETVNAYLDENYRNIPNIVTLAPVCRPGWLVEVECIAISDAANPSFANF